MSSLVNSLKAAALRGEQLYLSIARVDEVDEEARVITCTPIDDGAQLINVQLQGVTNGENGACIVPALGSEVVVGFLDRDNAVVVLCSEVERVTLDVNDTIVINGGTNGGLVKIQELTDKVNDLVQAFNNHVHNGVIVAVSGGSGAPAVGTPGNSLKPTASASTFNKTDYENENVKH
jgi:hypothetical protein